MTTDIKSNYWKNIDKIKFNQTQAKNLFNLNYWIYLAVFLNFTLFILYDLHFFFFLILTHIFIFPNFGIIKACI